MIGIPSTTPRDLQDRSYLFSENAPYVEDLYARYLNDPASVSESWRRYFAAIEQRTVAESPRALPQALLQEARAAAPPAPTVSLNAALKQAAVLRLINVYRVRGHQQADVDPMRLRSRPPVPDR